MISSDKTLKIKKKNGKDLTSGELELFYDHFSSKCIKKESFKHIKDISSSEGFLYPHYDPCLMWADPDIMNEWKAAKS